MTTVLGIWCVFTRQLQFNVHILHRHLIVEGGKARLFQTPTAVQITNVAFGEEITDANSRTVVKLTFDSLTSGLDDDEDIEDREKAPKSDDEDEGFADPKATTVLCSLTPGKVRSRTHLFAILLKYFVD